MYSSKTMRYVRWWYKRDVVYLQSLSVPAHQPAALLQCRHHLHWLGHYRRCLPCRHCEPMRLHCQCSLVAHCRCLWLLLSVKQQNQLEISTLPQSPTSPESNVFVHHLSVSLFVYFVYELHNNNLQDYTTNNCIVPDHYSGALCRIQAKCRRRRQTDIVISHYQYHDIETQKYKKESKKTENIVERAPNRKQAMRLCNETFSDIFRKTKTF